MFLCCGKWAPRAGKHPLLSKPSTVTTNDVRSARQRGLLSEHVFINISNSCCSFAGNVRQPRKRLLNPTWHGLRAFCIRGLRPDYANTVSGTHERSDRLVKIIKIRFLSCDLEPPTLYSGKGRSHPSWKSPDLALENHGWPGLRFPARSP